MTARCKVCAKRDDDDDEVNHPPGMIFIGWGRGWETCPRCNGTTNDPDAEVETIYDVPTVGTCSRGRACGCKVGLLSDVEPMSKTKRMHAGSLQNPWIVIPCEKHKDEGA